MKRILILFGVASLLFFASCSVVNSDLTTNPNSTGNLDTECARVQPQHYVLVHGSWHSSWAWFKIADMLKAKGNTVTLVDLPGHGIDQQNAGTATLADYQNRIVSCLDSIHEPVILIGHSMGGVVISMAAEARPNKIKKLVYLAGFLLTNNQSLFDVAGQDTNSEALKYLVVNGAEGTVDINRDHIQSIFYGNSEPQYVELFSSLFKPEPFAPLVTPVSLSAGKFGTVRKYYIETLQDHAISPYVQEKMIHTTKIEKVYKMNTDHSPFFSSPNELISIIQNIAAQ